MTLRPLHSIATLREALQCLLRSDLPARNKAALIEAVMQTLREREAAEHAEQSTPERHVWQETEIEKLRTLLTGHAATSWQDADELATRCARELHCAPASVREQAALLGLSDAVDYRPRRSKASER